MVTFIIEKIYKNFLKWIIYKIVFHVKSLAVNFSTCYLIVMLFYSCILHIKLCTYTIILGMSLLFLLLSTIRYSKDGIFFIYSPPSLISFIKIKHFITDYKYSLFLIHFQVKIVTELTQEG